MAPNQSATGRTDYFGFETSTTDNGVLTVTFNRPETMNASTAPMKRDLVELLTQAQMDDDVRVLVFTGQGRAFWAGDDLKGYEHTQTAATAPIFGGHHNASGTYNGLRTISQAVNTAVRHLDKLTIAAINGFAIQTGFSFALACDFRIAARSARMGSATLRFGLLPDEGGQWLLTQHMGVAKAMDFMMRKRIVDADAACELGLVHEVVEDDQLPAAAAALASELAEGPQVAMRMLKRSIHLAAQLTWDQSLDEIASKTAITDHLPDAAEGVSSFVEKRQPQYNAWLR
ncbi:enoyl-CoA hydratase/isomerase family protein [Candidatus Poriferisodalis sp.]|uniref:enoyl-CoA hydratase/isomerase family protein n=1 Tax=Candidatus Poriferisodalis sp. TaxID=3101277 RepID=UPI003B0299FB